MSELAFWIYPLLFGAAFLAGWVDSIAGGGGMVTIPVLLAVGLPAPMVLGTNKLQASFGSFTAARHYARKDVVRIRDAWWGIVCTLVGSATGTYAVQQVNPAILNVVIPFLLLGIALLMLFTPSLGTERGTARVSSGIFYLVAGLGLGFYDGFFGPGVGTFWAIAFVLGRGFDLTTATGYTKLMNFTSNVVSLVVFLIGGHVLFAVGLLMGVGQVLGARLGAGMVVRRGTRFMRPLSPLLFPIGGRFTRSRHTCWPSSCWAGSPILFNQFSPRLSLRRRLRSSSSRTVTPGLPDA